MPKVVKKAPCPYCGRGVMVWSEDGKIRCETCGATLPKQVESE